MLMTSMPQTTKHTLVLAVLVCASGFSGAVAAKVNNAGKQKITQEAAVIEEAKEAVRVGLKDPYSVQFENLRVKRRDFKDQENAILVCGTYNAKNSYGGYVGVKPFFYTPYNHELASEEGPTEIFYNIYCK
jgi:hypothetical protein